MREHVQSAINNTRSIEKDAIANGVLRVLEEVRRTMNPRRPVRFLPPDLPPKTLLTAREMVENGASQAELIRCLGLSRDEADELVLWVTDPP